MPGNDKYVKLPVFTGWLQLNRGNAAICVVFPLIGVAHLLQYYFLIVQIFRTFCYKFKKCYI